MKETIEELWSGSLHPGAERTPENPEIRGLRNQMNDNYYKLYNNLTEEGKKVLNDYEASSCLLEGFNCKYSFARGFSLGIRFIIEAFSEEKDK